MVSMTTTVKQAKSIPYLDSSSIWGKKVNKFMRSQGFQLDQYNS